MASTLPDRSTPPEPAAVRPFHLPEVEGEDLAEGLRVRSLFRGEIPLVSACLLLDSGETTVPFETAGLAVLTGDALAGGTARRDAGALARALEALGVTLRVSTGWDATTLTLTCLADRFDEALEILAEVVLEPAFPESEVERIRAQRLAAIRQRRMEPSLQIEDECDRILFPVGHPYHRPLSGEPETVGALARGDALAFAEARYRPGRSGLVVVGDLRADEVLAKAESVFGAWKGVADEAPGFPEPVPASRRPVILVDRPGAVQSELRIGLPGPSRGEPDEAALEVGNAILGGAFTSRLNLKLREEKGFTYGVRSRFAMRRLGGSFVIGTSVQREVTIAALSEALETFERFVREGPTEEEVVRARDYLAGVFPLRMETGAQLAARIAELLIYDLPMDYHHQYRDRIRAVTVEDVRLAMAARLAPERAPAVVLGDAATLREGLEALGVGRVEVRAG